MKKDLYSLCNPSRQPQALDGLMENYERLGAAVMALACRDYIRYRKRLDRCPNDTIAAGQLEYLRKCFEADNFGLLTGITVDALCAQLDKRAREGKHMKRLEGPRDRMIGGARKNGRRKASAI